MKLSPLTAISPIDGRYASITTMLRPLWSEYGLLRFRVFIEIRWLQALTQCIPELASYREAIQKPLNKLAKEFNLADAQRIKNIEKKINHDIKAVEYFLREKIKAIYPSTHLIEFIHFACTSEDINNLAYGLLLKTCREEYLLPSMKSIIDYLVCFASKNAQSAMLGRTHGQPAVPTTVGKELAIVAHRLKRCYQQFSHGVLYGKLNGAIGNYNAHVVAYPDIPWQTVSKQFVESLGLTWNSHTTQIESHDGIITYCDHLKHFNNILINLASDIWGYIALAYFKQKKSLNEIGSSTMPHKVNPIDFENAEANLGLANNLLEYFTRALSTSRWQRDLRDSSLLRNLGVPVSHSLLAYQRLLQGLQKLELNKERLLEDLNRHWEILAEAIQTVLRRYGVKMPYEKLRALTQGKQLTQNTLQNFIEELDLPETVKNYLKNLTPENYLGYAPELAQIVSIEQENP